jgi:hypothetical protein
MSKIADPEVKAYHWPSFYLSRFNFIAVHLFTVFYWFPFLFNNPFNFWWVFSTLDVPQSQLKPKETCTPIIWDNVKVDVLLWLLWWAQHSIMSRNVFKKLIGTYQTPFDRPLFGLASCIVLPAWTIFYKPITDCVRIDFTDLSHVLKLQTLVNFFIVFVCVAFVLSYFWILPSHVFGTDTYRILKNPPKPELILGFP